MISVLLTGILLICFYHHDILNANNLGYGVWGDGYKNFYTLAYYVNYGSGSHFTGMNYPFGENILFTDNQPLLAVVLNKAAMVLPAIKSNIHLIISTILFLSVVFSTGIIYLLLIELEVLPFVAAISASFIALMSPNFDHFLSLYSLAYTHFIPLLLYFTYKIITTERILRNALWCSLAVLCFTFIHLYFLAFALLFIVSVAVFYLMVIKIDRTTAAKRIAALLVTVIVPLLALKLFLVFTDSITDRPQNPSGYLVGYSQLHYILLHPNSVLFRLIEYYLPTQAATMSFGYDAKCYIGLSNSVLLVIGSVLFIKNKLQKRQLAPSKSALLLLLLASVPVLLFAMAIPFQYKSFEPLFNALPNAIKQFRAAARFSWIFYYTAGFAAVVVLNHLFLKAVATSKIKAYALLAIVFGVWLTDTTTTNTYQAKNFKEYATVVNEEVYKDSLLQKLKHAGYNVSSFQAIIPLPFYHIGSEKIGNTSSINFTSMQASLITGLPLFSCQMSRTSISQSLSTLNLFSNAYLRKDILRNITDKRPVLLMTGRADLTEAEKKIRRKASYLFTHDGDDFLLLPLTAFDDSIDAVKEKVKTEIALYTNHQNYLSNSIENTLVFKRETKTSTEETITLFNDTLPSPKPTTSYEFSVWFYADSSLANFPIITLTQTDASGAQIQKCEYNTSHATDSYNGWVRASIPFSLTNSQNIISVSGWSRNAVYNNMLIRPIKTDVITNYKSDSNFTLNNYHMY